MYRNNFGSNLSRQLNCVKQAQKEEEFTFFVLADNGMMLSLEFDGEESLLREELGGLFRDGLYGEHKIVRITYHPEYPGVGDDEDTAGMYEELSYIIDGTYTTTDGVTWELVEHASLKK